MNANPAAQARRRAPARALAPRTLTKASASRMNTRVWFSRCDKTKR